MMIKLNPLVKTVRHYSPPFPVTRYFDDIDRDAPIDEQIEQLLWIPATLVCRYLGQFPTLESEADEMFSIGVAQVVDVVNRTKYPGDKIGAVVNVQCRYHIESYCNGLDSMVKVCTKTRYVNRNKGKETPVSMPITYPLRSDADDMVPVILADAAEVLQIDLTSMTLREKRALAEILDLTI